MEKAITIAATLKQEGREEVLSPFPNWCLGAGVSEGHLPHGPKWNLAAYKWKLGSAPRKRWAGAVWRWLSCCPSPSHQPEEIHLVKNDPHQSAGMLSAAGRGKGSGGGAAARLLLGNWWRVWTPSTPPPPRSPPPSPPPPSSWPRTPVLDIEAQRDWATGPSQAVC